MSTEQKMYERRNGVVTLYPDRAAKLNPRKTFICLGVPRGGTSAVAGTMQRLGLFIGENLPDNYEDPNFVGTGVQKIRATIKNRNENFNVWGWKTPEAANYLEDVKDTLENPHLIIVFRDIAATMKGQMRWHGRGELRSAHEVMLLQQRNWYLQDRWRVPTALISYEKSITYPWLFASNLASFMSLPAPSEDNSNAIAQFLKPGSYKS